MKYAELMSLDASDPMRNGLGERLERPEERSARLKAQAEDRQKLQKLAEFEHRDHTNKGPKLPKAPPATGPAD